MSAVKHSFVGETCNLALHSAGQIGNIKNVKVIRLAAGVLTYEEICTGKIYHTTLPFVIEEVMSEDAK